MNRRRVLCFLLLGFLLVASRQVLAAPVTDPAAKAEIAGRIFKLLAARRDSPDNQATFTFALGDHELATALWTLTKLLASRKGTVTTGVATLVYTDRDRLFDLEAQRQSGAFSGNFNKWYLEHEKTFVDDAVKKGVIQADAGRVSLRMDFEKGDLCEAAAAITYVCGATGDRFLVTAQEVRTDKGLIENVLYEDKVTDETLAALRHRHPRPFFKRCGTTKEIRKRVHDWAKEFPALLTDLAGMDFLK